MVQPSVSSVSYDTAACDGVVEVTEDSPGLWAGQIALAAGDQQVSGWTVGLEFTSSVDWLESVMANVTGADTKWSLHSRDWDQNIPAGGHLDLKFLVDYSSARPSVLTVTFNGESLCSGGQVCAAPDCSNNYQVESDNGQWQQILVKILPTQVSCTNLTINIIFALRTCPAGLSSWISPAQSQTSTLPWRPLQGPALTGLSLTKSTTEISLLARSSASGLPSTIQLLLLTSST